MLVSASGVALRVISWFGSCTFVSILLSLSSVNLVFKKLLSRRLPTNPRPLKNSGPDTFYASIHAQSTHITIVFAVQPEEHTSRQFDLFRRSLAQVSFLGSLGLTSQHLHELAS